jgi:methionyl-tRNA synthetase
MAVIYITRRRDQEALPCKGRFRYKKRMAKPKYYVTAPVYDRTASPGAEELHSAILSDVVARHRRMCGFDVAYFFGADMPSLRIEHTPGRSAGRRLSEQRNYLNFEEFARALDIRATHTARTVSAEHIHAVQTLLRRIMRVSHRTIYKHIYVGRYCTHDQIDITASSKPADCPLCGQPGEVISEERYFFRLSAFQNRLMALYKYHPAFVEPAPRSHEIERLIRNGLRDVPISCKAVGGGIPWPDDPSHIVSIYFSRLVNYVSGIGFGQDGHAGDDFIRYWPANLQVVGKHPLRSHAIDWAAFLMAAELPVAHHIYAHNTPTLEDREKGSVTLTEEFLQTFGGDALRYCWLREVPYDRDAQLTFKGLAARYHADLVDGYGQIAERIIMLVAQYCERRVPASSVFAFDRPIEIAAAQTKANTRFLFDRQNFSEGLGKVRCLVALVDQILRDSNPSEIANPAKKQQLTDVLHDACQALGLLTLILHPIIPRATEAIWRSLGQTTRLEDQLIDETPWCCLAPGTLISALQNVFPATGQIRSLQHGCFSCEPQR